MKTCLLYTTYNRTSLLRKSLDRVAELTRPDEVLVVDDGGEDGTFLATVGAPLEVRYIYTHNPGETMCSHARNVGVLATDADIIIVSEPEMYFCTDVIAQMVDGIEEYDKVISAGTIHHEQSDEGRIETLEGWVAPFIAAYRRSWLMKIGGWDETFPDPWGWDDTDLLTRLRILGVGQRIDLEIAARHMWHTSRACDQKRNERHFLSKNFNEGDETHLVANTDNIMWGVPKC